jgi:hypothetical protein
MSFWEPEPPIIFEAFGVQVEVTLGDPELEPMVWDILPPGGRPCAPASSAGRFGLWPTGDDYYEVTFEGAPIIEHASLGVALTMLDAEVRLFIAARAPDRVFVHAGVVAVDGHALLIPGESFTGKTTLVAALVKAGARYYSDEYAVLDEAGLVHPYAQPLAIRTDDGITPRRRVVTGLESDVGAEPVALAMIALTRYRPGFEWKPRRVSKGEGVVALMAHTIPALERPEQSLRLLRRAVAGATVLESDRGEAGPVADALLDELARARKVSEGRR